MSTLLNNVFNFDVWESMDQETRELTQTSEFWTQVQYEADRIDLMPPVEPACDMEDDVSDWRIEEPPEDPPKESIVHHDCMWFSSDMSMNNTFVPPDMMLATPGQSLLRRDPSPPRPETPPSVDGDDAPEFLHTVDVAVTARQLLTSAVAADHSYTFARQHIDYLGVQTPSDSGESEEEIDVVSISNTHQTLTHVATPTQTIVQDYSPTSYVKERYHSQRPTETVTAHRPRPTVARKRLIPPVSIPTASVPRRRRGPGRRGRSTTDTDSEAESPEIERRSIHNDMERLRRIGLKNLFDELKKQVPATKDKERAPKVVILREAAALCRRLREEEVEREHLKNKQDKLVAKIRKLRLTLAKRFRQY